MVNFVPMKSNTELTQKTNLRTHLTPQQVRFVRLLEMSGAEIEQAVKNELDDNPALESVREDDTPDDSENEWANSESTFNESADSMQAADYASEDDTPAYLLHAAPGRSLRDEPGPFEQHSESPSLYESLNAQLDVVDAPPRDIAVARYIIGYLDSNGRLSRGIADIAADISELTGANLFRADILPALDIVRYQLDPPGLGAVDLRECLLIQLRRRENRTLTERVAEEIIKDNFDLFTKKHFDRLRNVLEIDKSTFEDAIELIRSLDPKPGSGLDDPGADKNSHITPDFIVSPVEGYPGRFSVTLNQRLPELTVEQSFMVDTPDAASRMFIRRKRDEAETFIGLIRRRSETLLTVMRAIVTLQRKFFETEDQTDIRPMILNDLSKLTGLDSSVISRATSGKYVATNLGVYPLKMFFNDSPVDDEETSALEILSVLKKIVDEEDKRRPLSDRALSDALHARGYNIARRTVTKYREKNNIPVARLRKEY